MCASVEDRVGVEEVDGGVDLVGDLDDLPLAQQIPPLLPLPQEMSERSLLPAHTHGLSHDARHTRHDTTRHTRVPGDVDAKGVKVGAAALVHQVAHNVVVCGQLLQLDDLLLQVIYHHPHP